MIQHLPFAVWESRPKNGDRLSYTHVRKGRRFCKANIVRVQIKENQVVAIDKLGNEWRICDHTPGYKVKYFDQQEIILEKE